MTAPPIGRDSVDHWSASPGISLGRFRTTSETIDETTEKEARVMSMLTNGPRRQLEDDRRFFRVQLDNVAEDEYRASEIVDRFECIP